VRATTTALVPQQQGLPAVCKSEHVSAQSHVARSISVAHHRITRCAGDRWDNELAVDAAATEDVVQPSDGIVHRGAASQRRVLQASL
jgi:hypothetical protein